MVQENEYDDTIVALGTSFGEAAIHTIRLSGPDALKIINSCFKPKNRFRWSDKTSFTLHLGWFKDRGKNIDQVLVGRMLSPLSYTGEDVIEISCHGGLFIAQAILEICIKAGARLAEPGEFSKRAFLNGKLDLIQAESIVDLISAKNTYSVDLAVNQMSGKLSNEISVLREKVLEILAYIEAGIDFPEDDVNDLNRQELESRILNAKNSCDQLLRGSRTGRILREGLTTAIVGRPNVGKSSLLNAFVQEERAIVTDIPGTTRDQIREYVNVGGITLLLIDTAGIRDSLDPVEQIGIRRSWETLEKADLILLVVQAGTPLDEEEKLIVESYNGKVIVLNNKIDLLPNVNIEESEIPYNMIELSVKEHIGFDKLEKEIIKRVFHGISIDSSVPLLANIRHITALEKANSSLIQALDTLSRGFPWDIISIDIRQSLIEISSITGHNVQESLIDDIFTRFCIGK